MDIGLKMARDYIGLGPTNHVCCASAFTNSELKHASCDWLKPYLLMFDTVYVDEVGSLIYNAESRDVADTYQWLLDERVIDQYPRVIYREIDNVSLSSASQTLLAARNRLLDPDNEQSFDEAIFRAVASRWEAAVLSDFSETNAVCIEKSFHAVPLDMITTTALRVVVDTFPIPDENVPFQDIIQLRSDHELMSKRAPLRNWCRKLSSFSEAAVRDELESQLAEYQAYMRIQKLRFQSKSIEMLISAPLAIIEDIVKLRFGKIVSNFFKFSDQRIALAEAELKAPSRELSFIIDTNDRLGASGRQN